MEMRVWPGYGWNMGWGGLGGLLSHSPLSGLSFCAGDGTKSQMEEEGQAVLEDKEGSQSLSSINLTLFSRTGLLW